MHRISKNSTHRPRGPGHAALGLLALLLLPAGVGAAQAPEHELIERLRAGTHVLMIRHAHAPGYGDPEGFRLDDCATQRNLDDAGRAQARRIGDWLRAHGIARARIYSSQWCRCLETARLLNLGPVTELAALNSFHGRPQERPSRLTALREFLARQPRAGEPIVLVTHQVTIAALTNEGTASGHGVVLERGPNGALAPLGPLGFDQ